MSIWTPGGEIPVDRGGSGAGPASGEAGMSGLAGGPGLDDLSPEERARAEEVIAEMAEVQRQILSVPAAQVVANHVVGLYELAALHLSQERADLAQSQLAIDAMAAVLDGVGDRLGEPGAALRQALVQLQVAFVERRGEGAG